MADYAVGDLQGCFTPLQNLLDLVNFNPSRDHLYCVGDVVARGPDSLACLQFLEKHRASVTVTLGNHDLHLLACHFLNKLPNPKDKLGAFFTYSHREALVEFLQAQPLAVFHQASNSLISHAGIYPTWTVELALEFAQFASCCYQSKNAPNYFSSMYGNATLADLNSEIKTDKFKAIVNVFTRMRFLEPNGELNLSNKEGKDSDTNLIPWFTHPALHETPCNLVFGHWAALEGKTERHDIIALDTGYVWGGAMSLLNLNSKEIVQVQANI
ncbi:Bis(5'-nucleosyl)-tetraphosphatase, symmetrical [Pseudoalteromonas luteoviolacea B = ATCC 29581]|nr:Bis(5'-nucleosyl)-tetraphosphatase, symmetrical [Pseudoalteromonas luteoviolacea B = ATCC 29581]